MDIGEKESSPLADLDKTYPPQPWHKRRNSALRLSDIICFMGLAALYYFSLFKGWRQAAPESSSIQEAIEVILRTTPLIDGHNDFPIWIRAFYHNHIYAKNFTDTDDLFGQVDFPRLREGRLTGQFWSVYVECPKDDKSYDDDAYLEIVHDTLQQIDLVHRLIKRFPKALATVSSVSDVWRTFRSTDNLISSFLGIEGLHQIGNSASVLRMYYELGVRYIGLTHTCHNRYADSEEPAEALHGGLSAAGFAIVKEMNRVGLVVDLSHTSFDTQRDVLGVTKAPVMFSHSSAFAVCNHSRNVPDDILFSLRNNGGIIMITFYPIFTHCEEPSNATLSHVADHIQYVGELIGYRHVGIGSDFDGMAKGPEGLEDVSKYPDLIAELLRRGVSMRDLEGVVGGNVLRVLGQVEHVAERLALELPLEDDVKEFFGGGR